MTNFYLQRTIRLLLTVICLFIFLNRSASQEPALSLTPVITGIDQPIQIVNAGDGTNRLFVVRRGGTIDVYDQSHNSLGTFVTVSGVSTNNERGLFSMAFHPSYGTPSSNFFFVLYTNLSGDLELARYQVSAGNPNIANAAKTIVFTVSHPTDSHNGGTIHFGSDGYLYWSTGDGGGNGISNQAQDGTSLLGKMLRIAVNTSLSAPFYSIPASNPYVSNPNIRDEIWALGLRNPFRWSFDRSTNDMWIADVGEGSWEEINYRPANSTGGINYGWPCYEGNVQQSPAGCGTAAGYIFPVVVYANPASGGVSVTGGTVYRGTTVAANSSLRGYYLAADYITGNIYKIKPNGSGGWTTYIQPAVQTRIVNIGEAENGELYAVTLNTAGGASSGKVFKIGVSNGEAIPPPPPPPSNGSFTIFQPTNVPAEALHTGEPLEVGLKFRVTQAGYINGIRFYKGAGNTGTHIGHLWSSTGTKLGEATFTNETASGWQQILFTTPVAVTTGTTYIASYFSSAGYYAFTNPYFTSAVVNGPLRALANGEDGGNSVYKYSATSAFPDNTFQTSNYWADVVFSTTTNTDVTPPTITSVSPVNGATGVAVNTTVSAVFNEAMNAATISSSTVELRNPSGTLITSTVIYNASTKTATLTPSAALANSTVYTPKIKSGTSGVKDVAGNALANDYTWSFTTAAAISQPAVSIQSFDTKTAMTSTIHSVTGVPAGALLVLTTTNNTNADPYDCIVTSSPSLTWTKRADAGAVSSNNAEIWTAVFSAGGNISVTSNWGTASQTSVLYAVTGAETSLGGASGTGTLQNAPSVSVTTTRENSILFACTSDWNGIDGTARVLRDGATERYYFINPEKGYTTYFYTKSTTSTGSYTEGISSPTGQKASTAVLEIRAPGASPRFAQPAVASIEEKRIYSLGQNYPNPVNSGTTIQFTLPESERVNLSLFDVNGKVVKTLVNASKDAGIHTVSFNIGSLAKGIYYYRMQAGDFIDVKKLTIQ